MSDKIEHQRNMLKALQTRLRVLEIRRAELGDHTPSHITIEMEDLYHKISLIKQNLQVQDVQDVSRENSPSKTLTVTHKKIYHLFGIPIWSTSVSEERIHEDTLLTDTDTELEQDMLQFKADLIQKAREESSIYQEALDNSREEFSASVVPEGELLSSHIIAEPTEEEIPEATLHLSDMTLEVAEEDAPQAQLQKSSQVPAIATLFLRDKDTLIKRYISIFVLIMLASAVLFFIELIRSSSLTTISMSLPLLLSTTSGFILPALAILCLYTNLQATKYRIKKGYYGTNAREARELIHFILDHADDPNFPSGPDGHIFPNIESIIAELRTIHGMAGVTS